VTSTKNARQLSYQVETAQAAVATSEFSQEQVRLQAATAVAAQAIAQTNEIIARSRAIAALSATYRESNPALSMLLAVKRIQPRQPNAGPRRRQRPHPAMEFIYENVARATHSPH
jgi:hypothetical protein